MGIDPDDVLFAWEITDPRRGATQSAYRVVLSNQGRSAHVVWDSGEVHSQTQAFVEYGGRSLDADTRYAWNVQTADASGSWSHPSADETFTTGLREADWRALWLRPPQPLTGPEEYTYFRKEKLLPAGEVEFATAYVAAAHKYRLWVNGRQVDSGPSFCFPDEQYYQATDVTPFLRPGRENVIGILHHWYGPGRGRPTSAPGVLAQLSVHYSDGRSETIGSDGEWTSSKAEWLPAPQRNNDGGDFVEWIDATRAPVGWAEAGFDDAHWQPPSVIGPVGTAPFTRLFAQRTRITELHMSPKSLSVLPTGSVVVDFGKVYAARPSVSFRSGAEGRIVPMHVGYTLDPDGSVSTTHNTQATDLSFSYTQRSGAQTFLPYTYLGFRYLQVDGPGEGLTAADVALAARHASMPQVAAATFESSNRMLDAVWELCAHSALYTSQEQFIDTPTREKGQFLWDACNESQTVMRVYREQNLSWQGLRDEARAQARYWPTGQVNEIYPNDDGPQNYPTFTALYPEWVWRYYMSTSDSATVSGLLPTLSRLADYLVSVIDPSTGLLSGLPLPTNGDNQYGYDYDTNADTTLNVLATNAFRRIAQVASLAGDPSLSAVQSARAQALQSQINARLVGAHGLYVDGLRSNGVQSEHSSQLANAAALAYGVAPKAMVGALGQFVASLDISVEPDHGLELLRALHAARRDHDVVRLLTDGSFPGWAAILESGGTFTWETWTPSDLIGDSMSHGWGSSALVAIQEILLGAAPEPAPLRGTPVQLTITPPSGGITRASGSFPTPAGTVSVSWRNGPSTSLSVDLPPNSSARCTLPGSSAGAVTESGSPVEQAKGVTVSSAGQRGVTVEVGAGSYDFEVRPG